MQALILAVVLVVTAAVVYFVYRNKTTSQSGGTKEVAAEAQIQPEAKTAAVIPCWPSADGERALAIRDKLIQTLSGPPDRVEVSMLDSAEHEFHGDEITGRRKCLFLTTLVDGNITHYLVIGPEADSTYHYQILEIATLLLDSPIPGVKGPDLYVLDGGSSIRLERDYYLLSDQSDSFGPSHFMLACPETLAGFSRALKRELVLDDSDEAHFPYTKPWMEEYDRLTKVACDLASRIRPCWWIPKEPQAPKELSDA